MAGWDLVYDHLLTLLPTLDGMEQVFDGPPVGDVPAVFGIVGDDGSGSGGTYSQDYDTDVLVIETGEVRCVLGVQSGDTALDQLRSTLSSLVDDLTASIRADKTLGGVLMQGSTVSVARVEPSLRQTEQGAVAEAVVAVGYTTRL